jgi:acetyltransferase-like isoleucine patch superfamily enzyme
VHLDADVHLLRFPNNIFIEADVAIKRGAHLCSCNERATIRIGERTTVGYYAFIFASERIEIGADCLIAPFVYIVDSNHSVARSLPINQQLNTTAPIRIGRDVWVAAGACILAGVTIGDGAVVAAGAVVKDDVAPYTIVAGLPAHRIGERQ